MGGTSLRYDGCQTAVRKTLQPGIYGKIERLNRTVDSFLDEVALKNCRSLDEYNQYFNVWLQECYHDSRSTLPGCSTRKKNVIKSIRKTSAGLSVIKILILHVLSAVKRALAHMFESFYGFKEIGRLQSGCPT